MFKIKFTIEQTLQILEVLAEVREKQLVTSPQSTTAENITVLLTKEQVLKMQTEALRSSESGMLNLYLASPDDLAAFVGDVPQFKLQ